MTPPFVYSNIPKVSEMDKILEQSLLYDFYGELLTEHQRKVYEDVVLNDYSLSEVAEEYGISRQGVHDLVKRCTKILESYEEKLHLLGKFMETKKMVNEINELTKKYLENGDIDVIHEIERISNNIVENF